MHYTADYASFFNQDDAIAFATNLVSNNTIAVGPNSLVKVETASTKVTEDGVNPLYVKTEEELLNAIKNTTTEMVFLASDIALTKYISLDRSVTLDGKGYKISGETRLGTLSNDNIEIVIKNLKMVAEGNVSMIKVPSQHSLKKLVLDNVTLDAWKAIYIADSKGNSTISKLSITNSKITSFYPVYIDHNLGSMDISNNEFIINQSGIRGIAINQHVKATGPLTINNNNFNVDDAANSGVLLIKNDQTSITTGTVINASDNTKGDDAISTDDVGGNVTNGVKL